MNKYLCNVLFITLYILLVVFVFLALLLFSLTSQAREIYYGSRPELVRISKETIFRFHKQVRTISQAQRFEIKPADSNDPDYSMLSIRPRFTKGTSKVAFVLSDGSVVTLKIKIVKSTNNSSDSKHSSEPFYDLRPKSMLLKKSEKNLPAITVMDFMRSMDRDDNIVGYKRRVENRLLFTTPLRVMGPRCIKTRLTRTYTGKEYKGFVVRLSNVCKTAKFKVEVDQLKFKGSSLAIMSLVDHEVLCPTKRSTCSTFLKIVAKPTASVNDLMIPTFVKHEKNQYEENKHAKKGRQI